jgi:hypothetical protein
LREARQKHAEILKMTNKLMEELANCEGNGATELNEQIQANRKEEEESLKREEELAKKLNILMKKYEIKMANKMDDYVSEKWKELMKYFILLGYIKCN